VRTVQPAGEFSDDATLVTLVDANGAEHALAMSHFWPVRTPLGRLLSDKRLFFALVWATIELGSSTKTDPKTTSVGVLSMTRSTQQNFNHVEALA
jgi:hypothetical protein